MSARNSTPAFAVGGDQVCTGRAKRKGGRMNSIAYRILEPIALAAGFLIFWGVLVWAGLRWVDDGAPRPIAREVSR